MKRYTKPVNSSWKYELKCSKAGEFNSDFILLGDIDFVKFLGSVEDILEKYQFEDLEHLERFIATAIRALKG